LGDEGEKGLTLSEFEWDKETKTMLYGQLDYSYGEILNKPVIEEGNPTRLYSLGEIQDIMEKRKMAVKESYGDYNGNPYSENKIQLMVISEKL